MKIIISCSSRCCKTLRDSLGFGRWNTESCALSTCTLETWKHLLQKFPVHQATQHKQQQQLLLYTHGWKDRQACVFIWHKSSSVGLYSPSHLIPSARHELPSSSFLSMPPGPCLILPIFPLPIFLPLTLSLLCSISLSLSSVFSCSST